MAGNAIPIPGSLARPNRPVVSLVRSSVRSLNPATSRINIPNNHAGRVTNAVPAPLAANWTRSGMLAQVLSYASVGDSQFSVVIATELGEQNYSSSSSAFKDVFCLEKQNQKLSGRTEGTDSAVADITFILAV